MIFNSRKLLFCFFIFCYCCGSVSFAKPDVPSYAKWGQLAVQTAKDKYPKAAITDYLHIGRVDKGTASIEKFKLILVENENKFGLFIDIEFDRKTEKVIGIITKTASP